MSNKFKYLIKQSGKFFIKPQKPNFLIIGAQKAGTTSLHYYLDKHPLIQGAPKKEVAYFTNNYKSGVEWYHNQFKNIRNPFPKTNTLFFESTPEYIYSEKALKRIFHYNSELKLILLLRDPVKRAFSSWNMYRDFKSRKNGIPKSILENKNSNLYKELYESKDFPSFEESIKSELKKLKEKSELSEPSFIRRGIYFNQVNSLFKLFPKSNILFLDFEDFVKDYSKILNEVLHFLEIEHFEWSQFKLKEYNKRNYISKISEESEEMLKMFYEPHNLKLFNILNKKFNW